jgi:hypothetical protein
MRSAIGLLALLWIGACVIAGDEVTTSSVDQEAATAPTHYSLRRDLRKCAYPTCGGWWVAPVNARSMRCPSGGTAAECYLVDVDFSAVPAAETSTR